MNEMTEGSSGRSLDTAGVRSPNFDMKDTTVRTNLDTRAGLALLMLANIGCNFNTSDALPATAKNKLPDAPAAKSELSATGGVDHQDYFRKLDDYILKDGEKPGVESPTADFVGFVQVGRDWLTQHGLVGSVEYEPGNTCFVVGLDTEGNVTGGIQIPISTSSHEISIAVTSDGSKQEGQVSLQPNNVLVALVMNQRRELSRVFSWSCKSSAGKITLNLASKEPPRSTPEGMLAKEPPRSTPEGMLAVEQLRVWHTLGPLPLSNNPDSLKRPSLLAPLAGDLRYHALVGESFSQDYRDLLAPPPSPKRLYPLDIEAIYRVNQMTRQSGRANDSMPSAPAAETPVNAFTRDDILKAILKPYVKEGGSSLDSRAIPPKN